MTETLHKPLALLLCACLGLPVSVRCQSSTAQPSTTENGAQGPIFRPGLGPGDNGGQTVPLAEPGIRILVLEGSRPNRLTEGRFSAPVVEVRDANDKPIEGAQVTFILPGKSGAGASFIDGSLEKTFSTNAQGQAYADGYRPNAIEGKFNVRARANYQGQTVELIIPQSNTFQLQADADRAKSRAWKKWLIIGGAGAAAGITAYLLLRSGSSASSNSGVITVIPGPPVLGGR